MTTAHFLIVAIIVFSLMLIGIVLTIKEFKEALRLERKKRKKTSTKTKD